MEDLQAYILAYLIGMILMFFVDRGRGSRITE